MMVRRTSKVGPVRRRTSCRLRSGRAFNETKTEIRSGGISVDQQPARTCRGVASAVAIPLPYQAACVPLAQRAIQGSGHLDRRAIPVDEQPSRAPAGAAGRSRASSRTSGGMTVESSAKTEDTLADRADAPGMEPDGERWIPAGRSGRTTARPSGRAEDRMAARSGRFTGRVREPSHRGRRR